MSNLLGANIITSDLLPPGTVLMVNTDMLRKLTSLMGPPKLDFDGYDEHGKPLPYDHRLVPHGHEPFMLLKGGDWLFWHDRVRLNNDLIKIFGTKPKPPKFRFAMDFKMPKFNSLHFAGISV